MNEDYVSPVRRKVNEFHVRHGSECYTDGEMFYYPDGASRDVNPIGVLMEPPNPATEEGEYHLFLSKLTFARLKLKAAVREFDDVNTRLANTVPMDPDNELAKLKALSKVVEERKKLLAGAERALAKTRWGQQQAAARNLEEDQRRRMEDFQHARRAIRI